MPTDDTLQGFKPLVIRRGIVESVDIYEIKDSELDDLETGTSAELQLNFAIFLISTAFSAITTLFTATFSDSTVKTTFIVVAVVGVLLGAYLMIAWWRAKSAVKELCKTIRLRISLTEARAKETAAAEEGGAVPPASAGPGLPAEEDTPSG
jgi:hypothetical protein